MAGRVVKLNIEEGMSFQKGDVLAEIDSTPYEALLAEAKAQVAAAKARLAELQTGSRPEEIAQALAELDDAKAQLVQAKREWQRFEAQKTLSITTREYEQAEAAYLSGVKRVEAKQKAYDLAKLGPRQERIDAGAGRVRGGPGPAQAVPVEARQLRHQIAGHRGDPDQEGGDRQPHQPGGRRGVHQPVRHRRPAEAGGGPGGQRAGHRPGPLDQACRVKADAYPDRAYEGYVERVMPMANRAKSIVPVRIKVVPRDDEKQGQYLKPEMGVTVTFLNRERDRRVQGRGAARSWTDDSGTVGRAERQ